MAIVEMVIDPENGTTEVTVIDGREDLLHDFEFFFDRAKERTAGDFKARSERQRFLRAALMMLFAYADAVVNGWVKAVLDNHNMGFLYERLKFDCLAKKAEFLYGAHAEKDIKLDVKEAKSARNLWVHFSPGFDIQALDALTLSMVEDAKAELDRWMTEMESMIGLPRHSNTEAIMDELNELGETVIEATTDSRK